MNTGIRIFTAVVCALVGIGLLGVGLNYSQGQSKVLQAPSELASEPLNPGPDLMVQSIRITPAYPAPNQAVNIEMTIANRGTSNAGGFTTFLYVDPPGPPQPNTPDTSFTYLFGLNAGRTYVWTFRNYIFETTGCQHAIYVWTDRDNQVAEDDETNNLASIPVCVGTTPTATPTPTVTPSPTATATPTVAPCQPDAYEADASCVAAKTIGVDGVHQLRSLCPVGDEDWVKFTAQADVTYTLSTANVGPDGDTVLSLYNQCNVPPTATSDPAFGDGVDMTWQAPASGVYYLQVKHHAPTYGPRASYELFITASTDCQGDVFEQDDSCATGRDVSLGVTSPQLRQFCKPGDQDWVKFSAVSGATYVISATATGPDASPIISLYNGCAFGPPSGQGQQVEFTAPESGIYYVNVRNHNPNAVGPTTQYNLRINMTGCAPDSFEPDNTFANASTATPGVAQSHDTCGAGDQDWVKFQAAQGQLYVIETFELGNDADTVLCLFGTDGATQISCNDDGGGGLASRIRWTAPAAGTYYLRVKHSDATISGPATSYRLGVSAGEPADNFETDNAAAQAKPIPTDGATQTHNFTPAGDYDWVRFDAVAGEPYVIQTSNLAGDCDTVLDLLGTDGTTVLASNDEYGGGTQSRITYVFSAAGTYYARVHHYRSNRSGQGTRYDLSVTRGAQPPTPTPTPTSLPGPTPTPTPPSSGVKTLIVTNRERLEALYGAPAATNIMNRLSLLASDPRVRGAIIQVENNSAALTAYALWNSNPISTTLANNVASAVRNLILTNLSTNPGVEYIVLVGNDRVIPFRRIPDRTRHPESNYQAFVSGNTTIWAACRDNMSLTDDFYADREPSVINNQEVYVPDYALGRLPEGATDIINFIDGFLAGGQVHLQNVLVTGYDFVADAGQAVSSTIASDLGPTGVINGSLMGDWWQASALRGLQLGVSPAYNVQFIQGHATHHLQGAPQGGGVTDAEIANSATNPFNQALVVTLGCHSGLNDVGGLPAGLDLAQAFFRRGSNYIANTGYGWGSNAGLGWSERLVNNYVRTLTQGGATTLGKAVMNAKQRYFNESTAFDAYDEKALQESTLYGLPHYQMISGGLLGPEDPFPSVHMTPTLPLDSGPVRIGGLNFTLSGSFGALDEHQTTAGAYFAINESVQVAAGQPVQPQFYADVTSAASGRVHGAFMNSGHYSDTVMLDPVISQPVNEWVPPAGWAEPAYAGDGWWPERPLDLQNLSSGRNTADTLLVQLGQYNGGSQHERVYDNMDLDVLYSNSADWTGPEITYVGERMEPSGQMATVKVEASDLSGILSGKVTYTQGDGQWHSVDLAFDPARAKWLAQIPASPSTRYFVQMADNAGNVTVADNKGRYYDIALLPNLLYLPLLNKR